MRWRIGALGGAGPEALEFAFASLAPGPISEDAKPGFATKVAGSGY